MSTLKLRFGSREYEVPDCKSCQVQNSAPRCLLGLDMANCSTCERRESRNGDYHHPPLVIMSMSAPGAKRVAPNSSETAAPFPAPMRGLGDVVAKVAAAIGIKPTKGCKCKERQAALNRLVPFGKNNPPPASQPPAGADGGERMV